MIHDTHELRPVTRHACGDYTCDECWRRTRRVVRFPEVVAYIAATGLAVVLLEWLVAR